MNESLIIEYSQMTINNAVSLCLVPECKKECPCKESPVCGNNNVTYGSLCDLDNEACTNPTLVLQSVGHCGKTGRQMKGTTDRHTDREKDIKAERKKNRKTARQKD
jgi:hypothetical protein